MDAYPEDYISHNLPLILLSGLEADANDDLEARYPLLLERGFQIESDIPPVTGQLADNVLNAFLKEDASDEPWNAKGYAGQPGGIGFRLKSIGRSYRLPSRKADLPPTSPVSPSEQITAAARVLHSPISPLTPGSPTFPDGFLTPLWVTKHQNLVPAATVNFFPLTADPNMSSLRDNQLKIEISNLKNLWVSSGYKARFVVVLISEDDIYLEDVEDRLASIRRAANLDPRSTFVLPPDLSHADLKDFVATLLSSLQPSVVEYYRDLSKHARRKRNRGSVPPPTVPPTIGTSQTLSLHGWNVRYEFKLGVFAEFRQEMDAAFRNYESAYEILFGQEVFESIAGWNLRFNDARLLADSLAIRILRCSLWSGQTTNAVRRWVIHRDRTQDIVNRRGKGTKNYGWAAWEARWSMVMAQLIQRAEIPSFSADVLQNPSRLHESIFTPPEKNLPVHDIALPWELLHHEGYWLDRSAKYSTLRRTLAHKIPADDRIAPGQTPASKSYMCDTYLVPAPYSEAPDSDHATVNHSGLILDTLKASLEQFSKRQQIRKVERLSLQIAKEYVRVGSWSEALNMLKPLWPQLTWRSAGWWELMEEFAWTLRECALRLQDNETVIRTDWELLSHVFSPRPGWKYDLHQSLRNLQESKPKPVVVLKAEDVVSCLSASLAFERAEGNVGEPLQVQLTISSSAHSGSTPIDISEVKIGFEGSLRPIKLQSNHDIEDNAPSFQLLSVPLHDSTASIDSPTLLSPTSRMASMIGSTNLTLTPSQTRAFNLTSIPREAGETKIASITLLIEGEKCDIVYAITDIRQRESYWWLEREKGPIRKRIGKDRDTIVCKILPKPPKVRISTPNLRETYYTNENVTLDIHIHNDEDEAAEVTAQIRLFGRPESTRLSWIDDAASSEGITNITSKNYSTNSISRTMGRLESLAKVALPLRLSNTNDALDFELEISLVYYLVTDMETPISKTMTIDLSFITPFGAKFQLLPRIHPRPWPNFFALDDGSIENESAGTPNGLQQKWCLNSKVVSLASEPLIIEKISLVLIGIQGATSCNIGAEVPIGPQTPQILPEELRESEFILDIQQLDLDDRQPSTLSLALDIQWRRPGVDELDVSINNSTVTTSSLAVKPFPVSMGEPRVLASAATDDTLPGMIYLDYTIENPSMHFLTFSFTMEASEQFAFSGPKTTVIQLVPLSRHTVRYNLLSFKQGLWIQPQLVVVDTYFKKTLRVLSTEGMRSDKKGILVWVDADG